VLHTSTSKYKQVQISESQKFWAPAKQIAWLPWPKRQQPAQRRKTPKNVLRPAICPATKFNSASTTRAMFTPMLSKIFLDLFRSDYLQQAKKRQRTRTTQKLHKGKEKANKNSTTASSHLSFQGRNFSWSTPPPPCTTTTQPRKRSKGSSSHN